DSPVLPGCKDVSFRQPDPAPPSGPESDACSIGVRPAAVMAFVAEVTRSPIAFQGPPASVSTNGVVPSTVPPITVLVGASGNATVVLTANPGLANAKPARGATWMAAEALLTTDMTYCGEFESMLR